MFLSAHEALPWKAKVAGAVSVRAGAQLPGRKRKFTGSHGCAGPSGSQVSRLHPSWVSGHKQRPGRLGDLLRRTPCTGQKQAPSPGLSHPRCSGGHSAGTWGPRCRAPGAEGRARDTPPTVAPPAPARRPPRLAAGVPARPQPHPRVTTKRGKANGGIPGLLTDPAGLLNAACLSHGRRRSLGSVRLRSGAPSDTSRPKARERVHAGVGRRRAARLKRLRV